MVFGALWICAVMSQASRATITISDINITKSDKKPDELLFIYCMVLIIY